MQDSWGDGWNGASIDVDVNGVITNVTLSAGSAGTQTVPALNGDVVTFTFNAGSFYLCSCVLFFVRSSFESSEFIYPYEIFLL